MTRSAPSHWSSASANGLTWLVCSGASTATNLLNLKGSGVGIIAIRALPQTPGSTVRLLQVDLYMERLEVVPLKRQAVLVGLALMSERSSPGSSPRVDGRSMRSTCPVSSPAPVHPGLEVVAGGSITVAMKDGVPMLKAPWVSEFEVSLPERLPDQFTLQFEIIPKHCAIRRISSSPGPPRRSR